LKKDVEKEHRMNTTKKEIPPPFEELAIGRDDIVDFERGISELTMRSSYGEATAKLSDNRRMAYYAVGKHHTPTTATKKAQQRGGNRRCYFTGKLIKGGRPFYAGSVQQGLRTLVVFCLPSALGLPKVKDLIKAGFSAQISDQKPSRFSNAVSFSGSINDVNDNSTAGTGNAIYSDGEDSEDGDGIKNGVGADLLLRVLPDPSKDLLDEMEKRYPEPYSTLPVQLRSPECWRLFTKFCFFSGLPIADGEMFFKVRDEVAAKLEKRRYFGVDEIILSHEVMEAVNGEQSAEILRLPNNKTFRYLQKHYAQQCSKLNSTIFDRRSWEMVMPEI